MCLFVVFLTYSWCVTPYFPFLDCWRHGFLAFPICTTSRLLFLVVREELLSRTHSHRCFHTLHHHTCRLQCEPLLSSADNKSEEWPLAASLCLTLSLCNPSSLPLLIYTCFSSHSSLPLLLPCSAPLVDSFVCTLFFADLFFHSPLPFSSSRFFVPCFSISHFVVCFISGFPVMKHAVFSPHPSSLFDLLASSAFTYCAIPLSFPSSHLMKPFAISTLGCMFTSPIKLNESKLVVIGVLPLLASMENDFMLQGHISLL